MKFMENTKINFMKFKSFGFGLSSVLAFGSIILLLMGVNLGIDFKGGTAIGVSFTDDVSIQEVRGSLKSVSLNDSLIDLSGEEIKYFGSQSDVMIKIKSYYSLFVRRLVDGCKQCTGNINTRISTYNHTN